MKIISFRTQLCAVLLIIGVLGTREARADSIVNGDFETGNLTGWTVFTTPNGSTGGPGFPTVALFDTSNSGTPSLSAQFKVGQLVITPADQEGGGIFQNVNLGAGDWMISANIASSNALSSAGNPAGGLFSVLFDGVLVAVHPFGPIAPGAIEYDTLSADLLSVSEGSHEVRILVTRPRLVDGPVAPSPLQYVDNVRIAAAPEPAALWLLASGLGGFAIVQWKRPRVTRHSSAR